MRRLVVWNVMTLDGCFEGSKPWDLDFHQSVWGGEIEAFSREQLAEVGTLLFGRKTYEGMADYWSTTTDEGETAPMMNAVPKAVISNTLTEATWNNTRLLRGRAEDVVRALKAEDGKDIFVFGSAELLDTLLKARLVDEIRLCIAPVVLGQGNPLFKRSDSKLGLAVKSARPLQSGGLLVFYEPKTD
jgi:dihydrofolate reductase